MLKKIMDEMANCKLAMEVGQDLNSSNEEIAFFKGKCEAYKDVLKMMGCNVVERGSVDYIDLRVKVDRHDPRYPGYSR